jgi:mono/diheme cytochrome c family protein
MRTKTRTAALVIAAFAITGIAASYWTGSAAAAQDTRAAAAAEATVWSGVYTEDQSKRGERVYADSCTSCHAAELTGGQVVPALVGDEFLTKWYGAMVGDLFEQIRMTMPQDAPGSLNPAQYADVLAYILDKNKFPAGKKELAGDTEALKAIRIEPKKAGKAR